MENSSLKEFAKLVHDYCGLNFLNNLSTLETKASKRLKELDLSYWEYCGYLKVEPQEWDILVQLLTINETYFFREENQLNELQNAILPQWKDSSRQNPLRIWSAACSTGEEPYSLAMLVVDTNLFSPQNVEIFATDIDKKVLKTAREGWYHKNSLSFRRMPKKFLDKYFLQEKEGYQVKQSIREMVKFASLNLLDKKEIRKLGLFDIIFCRNLLIYFDAATTFEVVSSLYELLQPGGYLFLGHADSITGMNIDFETINTPKTFYYRKGDNQSGTVRSISGR